jgi:hypothetical protein
MNARPSKAAHVPRRSRDQLVTHRTAQWLDLGGERLSTRSRWRSDWRRSRVMGRAPCRMTSFRRSRRVQKTGVASWGVSGVVVGHVRAERRDGRYLGLGLGRYQARAHGRFSRADLGVGVHAACAPESRFLGYFHNNIWAIFRIVIFSPGGSSSLRKSAAIQMRG